MDWSRGRTVGRGSTALVSIASDNRTGEVFAVKSAELSNSEALQREERMLSKLVCPQIVAYKGHNISSENGKLLYNLFLEYAPGGTLNDAICKCGGGGGGGGMEEGRIRSYARAILVGLEYLHSNGIVHCDIKGQNVLITSDGPKIADLGCARRVDEVSTSTVTISGTPVYMAPEVARGEQQGFSADVWALGCTLIEMATGRAPWADASNPVSALYRIGFSSDGPEIPKFMSKQGKDFLSKCLKRNPAERLTASELLQHEFVKEEKFPWKEIETCNPETPTSVLDQGIWNSMETWNSTQKRSANSARERIRKLSEGNSEMISWKWDETWTTVRSKESKELGVSSGNEISSSGGAAADTEEYFKDDVPDELFIRNSEINTSSRNNSSSSTHEEEEEEEEEEELEELECKFANDILLCRNLALMNNNNKIMFSNSTIACFEIGAQSHFLFLVYVPFEFLQESSMFFRPGHTIK